MHKTLFLRNGGALNEAEVDIEKQINEKEENVQTVEDAIRIVNNGSVH
mgnify:CR=1 FL=1